MREILFRGMRLDNGEWVYGYYSPVNLPLAGNMGHFINESGFLAVEIDPTTVCQYTGLKDKTGKKIFESDILAFDPGEGEEASLYLVKWDNAQWKVCMGGGYDDDDMTNWNSKWWMVVGDAYNNPELLVGM